MIKVEIGGTHYRVCSEWSDVTVQKASDLLKHRIPDSLKAVYDLAFTPMTGTVEDHVRAVEEKEQSISFEDQHKNIPLFFSRVIEALSDIPGEVLNKISVHSIKTIYHSYLRKFVEGVWYFPSEFQPMDLTSFEFDGETYYLPTSGNVFGEKVPLVDVTALEFCESADLQVYVSRMTADKDFSRIANIVSILCRPKGEKYNETVSLARAEKFKGLPMDIVWSVFFSLIRPSVILSQYGQISFLGEMAKEARQMN